MGGQRPTESDMTNSPMLITHGGHRTGVCVCVCVQWVKHISSFNMLQLYKCVTLFLKVITVAQLLMCLHAIHLVFKHVLYVCMCVCVCVCVCRGRRPGPRLKHF